MTQSDLPRGAAPIFPGWNVWELWQAEDPDFGPIDSVMMAGVGLDRQLRIWVENLIADGAPGAAVADPANPAALRGAQIQILPSAGELAPFRTRAELPELAGALQVGDSDSKARKVFVRFFNRGASAWLPWPHDKNFVLEAAYAPSSDSPLTSGEAPSSLAGAASSAAESAGSALLATIVAGVVVALVSHVVISRLGK